MGSTSKESDNSFTSWDISTSDEERQQQKRCCIKYFVEDTILSYSNQEFKKHFRLSREVVYALIGYDEVFRRSRRGLTELVRIACTNGNDNANVFAKGVNEYYPYYHLTNWAPGAIFRATKLNNMRKLHFS